TAAWPTPRPDFPTPVNPAPRRRSGSAGTPRAASGLRASVGGGWFGGGFRWDPLPGARAAPVGAAAVALLVVVPGAEACEGFDAGVVGFDVGAAVVDLEAFPYLAAGDDAGGVPAFEGGALVGPEVAAGVGDGGDRADLGQRQQPVPEGGGGGGQVIEEP